MRNCDICQFLKKNPNLIAQSKYWLINLAPDQAYLGRCYILLKRHSRDLANLSLEEWEDFMKIIKKLEASLSKAFDATLFNWGCLMNNAYQRKIPNPHVHWHFRPRYNQLVRFAGLTFRDEEFGHHYKEGAERTLDQNTLNKIKEEIQKYLSLS